jgi:hypothetical protein
MNVLYNFVLVGAMHVDCVGNTASMMQLPRITNVAHVLLLACRLQMLQAERQVVWSMTVAQPR